MKKIIPVKKILGYKALEHFKERMIQRNISLTDVESVLTKPDLKKRQPWRDRVILQKRIDRGYVTVILNSNEKSLKTCWVV